MFGIWLTLPAGAADGSGPAGEPRALRRIADGVYVSAGDAQGDSGGNAGAFLLGSAVAVFDTHLTPEAGRAFAAAIAAVTSKPVRYVVYSHFHPDHTHGTQAFPAAAQIIASTQTRREMLQKDIPSMSRMLTVAKSQADRIAREINLAQGAAQKEALRAQLAVRQGFVRRLSELRIQPPVLAIDDSLTVRDGDMEFRLLHFGPGHTDGDLVVFLPREKIVFLGGLFHNRALPGTQDATILNWIDTLREVLELPAEQFVPGHGEVGSRKDVEEFLGYLEDLKKIAEQALNRGDTLEQVLREARLPDRYAAYSLPEFFQANLQKAFAEMKALQAPATAEPPDPARKPAGGKPLP